MVLVNLFRREAKFWDLALYATAMTFLALAFLQAALSQAPTAKVNRAAYVFLPFMMPMAGLALERALKSKRKHLAFTSLLLVLIAVPIAARDPNISPREYAKIRGGTVPISSSDVLEAHTILQMIDVNIPEKVYVRGFLYKGYAYLPGKGKVEVVRSNLWEALKIAVFINDDLILPVRKIRGLAKPSLAHELSMNKVYDSERSFAFTP
ncbi:MAG: hypothetical protein N3H31_06930 [Candidatus Nezhaarchaeota archaeon]|nr:hypothetical protein [Candidatus Nezhaarchaeota archaeon]